MTCSRRSCERGAPIRRPRCSTRSSEAAEATPQARGWFRLGPMQASRRALLIAAIALLLAAAGAAIGARLLLPDPVPLLHTNGEIVAADEQGPRLR